MIRRLLPLFVVAFLLLPFDARAQTEGVGIGASLGVTNDVFTQNPVGLAGKAWVSDRQAVAGHTSFFIGDEDRNSYWILQADFLFHNFNELEVGEGLLALYVGPGAQLTINEDTENDFALRAPVGIDYMLGSAPIDVFVEVAPTLKVTDPVALRFDGAVGFRYFFTRE
jgi:hypothetical protein